MAAAPTTSNRWLHGMTSDLLIGCGGLYIFLFGGLVFAPPLVRSTLPDFLLPLLILMISVPHYGGTLVRVYQQREERRKYAVFTVYITAFLCGWFALGTYYTMLGSMMVTLYLTWSPWHYSGQNYGLVLMFLGRRGVTVTPLAKQALWASFVLSFILTLLSAHGSRGPAASSGGPTYEFIEFLPLGIPLSLARIAAPIIFTLYIAALATAAAQLLRTGRVRDLFPSAMILFSQSLWFVVPTVAHHLSIAVDDLGAAAYNVRPYIWMAAAHAAQYLWITSYYARHSSEWRGYGAYYRNTLLAGSLVWVLPLLLFAPYALGGVQFSAGLALLVAALVNLQHFVLDGAIWKLRNNRIGRVLIRASDLDSSPGAIDSPRQGWLGHGVWATAGVCAMILIGSYYQETIVYQGAVKRGDLALAQETIDRLSWIGRDRPKRRIRLGSLLEKAGDLDGAIAQYRMAANQPSRDLPDAANALALAYLSSERPQEAFRVLRNVIEEGYATAQTYYTLGTALATDGQIRQSVPALRKAIELSPKDADAHSQLGTALVMLNETSEGIEHYRESLAIKPNNPLVRRNLEAAVMMQSDRQRTTR